MTELIRLDWIALRRDLILHRRTLVLVAVIYTAFQAWFITEISSTTAWLVLNCIYMAVLTVVPLTIEGDPDSISYCQIMNPNIALIVHTESNASAVG